MLHYKLWFFCIKDFVYHYFSVKLAKTYLCQCHL